MRSCKNWLSADRCAFALCSSSMAFDSCSTRLRYLCQDRTSQSVIPNSDYNHTQPQHVLRQLLEALVALCRHAHQRILRLSEQVALLVVHSALSLQVALLESAKAAIWLRESTRRRAGFNVRLNVPTSQASLACAAPRGPGLARAQSTRSSRSRAERQLLVSP